MRARIVVLGVAAAVVAAVLVVVVTRGGGRSDGATARVTARRGGSVRLAGATVVVPPGGVSGDGRLVARNRDGAPPVAGEVPAGEPRPAVARLAPPVSFEVDGSQLTGPVTVTFRVAPTALPPPPAGTDPADMVWLSSFDPGARRWEPVESRYDPVTGVVTAQVSHLSWWAPWTWDWQGIELSLRRSLSGLGSGRAPETPCPGVKDVTVANAGGNDPPVIGCAAGAGPSGLTVGVTNNRAYAMVVEAPAGAELGPPTYKGFEEYLRTRADVVNALGGPYLAPTSTLDYSVASQGDPLELKAAPSWKTQVLDLAAPAATAVFNLVTAGYADCILDSVARSEPAPLSDAPGLVVECFPVLAQGSALLSFFLKYGGLVTTYVKSKLAELDKLRDELLKVHGVVTVTRPQVAVDWRNTRYLTGCGGAWDGQSPLTVDVKDGSGVASPGGLQTYAVRVVGVATGDLVGDAKAETAVLLNCHPDPSNFSRTEIQVFSAEQQRLAVLRPPELHPEGTGSAPDFADQPFVVDGRRLRTGGLYYGAGGCHAGGPSIRHDLDWTWNGSGFDAKPGPAGAGPGTLCTSPPTTVAAAGTVLLAADGLGVAAFGTDMDGAIAAVTAALGPPDYSGAWAARYCATGEGGGGRLVVWGQLSVLFNDAGLPVNGTRQFVGQRVLWGYDFGTPPFDQAAGREVAVKRQLSLRTPSGVGLGSTGQEIERVYGTRAKSTQGDPRGFPPPTYRVTIDTGQMLYLYMDANGPQGRIRAVSAGGGCGE